MRPAITSATAITGVVGVPVRLSLSPRLHNAWIEAAGLDAVYLAFGPQEAKFDIFLDGLRGVVRGLNVTMPFKERALAAADRADALAVASGAANLLLFHADGTIEARNTDGEGLIGAFRAQAPGLDLKSGPTVIFGAGGAARAAAAALVLAGVPEVRVVNRNTTRAVQMAKQIGPRAQAFEDGRIEMALDGAVALINATSLGMGGGPGPTIPWQRLAPGVVVMDMVYRPLRTQFLAQAAERGLRTVDGLEMLIRQAIPSFEALFDRPPSVEIDPRRLLIGELDAGPVIVLGLTGSIGMGKSTTAGLFREAGVPIYDADAEVAALYAPGGGAVHPIEAAFPGATRNGAVDRARLSALLQDRPQAFEQLEAIVHPLVAARREAFLERARDQRAPVAVLDIPLLFEIGAQAEVDAVVVASAPEKVQRERALARPGMTPEKLDLILARQVPDAEKRARADFVIDTASGLEPARRQVRSVLDAVRAPGWKSVRGRT